MSVANILNENGLVSGRLLDTSVAPLSLYAQNPAIANQDMASFDITAAGDVALTSITHASGGLNPVFIDAPLQILDTRGINFQTTTQNGEISADASLEINVNVAVGGGELLVGGTAAGGLVGAPNKIAMGDSAVRTDGGAAGTFQLQKDQAGVIPVSAYLPINVGGVNYWIPLMPSDPQTT